MSDYTVHIGIEHLSELDTCVSLAVDTETLQLQPEKGKLRLIQLGSLARKTIVLIDCFDLDDIGWAGFAISFPMASASGWRTTLYLTLAGCRSTTCIPVVGCGAR